MRKHCMFSTYEWAADVPTDWRTLQRCEKASNQSDGVQDAFTRLILRKHFRRTKKKFLKEIRVRNAHLQRKTVDLKSVQLIKLRRFWFPLLRSSPVWFSVFFGLMNSFLRAVKREKEQKSRKKSKGAKTRIHFRRWRACEWLPMPKIIRGSQRPSRKTVPHLGAFQV